MGISITRHPRTRKRYSITANQITLRNVISELLTSSKRYSVSLNKIGSMVIMNCKQTGRKPATGGLGSLMGLGGFFSVPETVDSDGWVNTEAEKRTSLLGDFKESLNLKLFLSAADTLEGYELEAHMEHKHIKLVRQQTETV